MSGTSSSEGTQRSTDYGTDDGSTAHRNYTSGMSKAKEKQRANIPVPGDKTHLGKRINNEKQHAKMARTSPLPAQASPPTCPPASTSSVNDEPNGESPVNECDESHGTGVIEPKHESPVNASDESHGIGVIEPNDESPVNASDEPQKKKHW